MPTRIQSPFAPGRRALVEPIVNPLYSSVEIAATPEAQKTFFQDTQGSAGNSPVYTNMEVAGILPNPKIFVIRGVRLHASQNVVLHAGNTNPTDDLKQIIESYWFLLKVGEKDYMKVPMFYLSSGLGLWAAVAEANTAADFTVLAALGLPSHENYHKIGRHSITIPPQQSFRAELNKGPTLASINAARRIWCFLEGSLAREVQ